MIFLINLPLGLFTLVAGAKFLPGGQTRDGVKLDVVGAFLAATAALLLVYPVVQGRELGWPAWVFVLMAASLVLFVVFARVEARTARRGGDPLIVPSLFHNRAFTGGLVTGLAIFTSMVGFALVLTIFLQVGLGFSPIKAGLSVLAQAIGSVAGFIAAGAGLADKLGRRALHPGTVLMAAGVLAVFVVLRSVGPDVSPWQLAPALLVYGIGLGLFLSPFFTIVLAGVAPQEYGSASGTLNAVQQFGSALGIAVLGTVFFAVLGSQVAHAVGDVDRPLRAELAAAGVPIGTQDRVVGSLRACLRDSADSTDQSVLTDSWRELDRDVGAAASAADDPAGVASAVRGAAGTAARNGFDSTFRRTLWAVLGLLALAFTLTFLLPLRAAEYADRTTAPGLRSAL